MRAGQIETVDATSPVRVLRLLGDHDLSTADELREKLRQETEGGQPVVLDLSRAEFIDSSIVAVVVEHGKAPDEGPPPLTLCIPPDASASIRRVVDLTGLGYHLPVIEDVAELAPGSVSED